MLINFNIIYSISTLIFFTQAQTEIAKTEEQFNKIRCKINQLRTESKSPIYPLSKLDFLDDFIKANLLKWEKKDRYSNRNFLNLLKDRLTKNDIPYYKVSQVISETTDISFTTSQLFATSSAIYKHLLDPSYTVAAGGFVPFGKKYLFILILLETDVTGALLPTCPPYFEPIPLKLGKITNPRYAHFDPISPLKFFFHGNNTHFSTYSYISESKRAHPFTRIASLNLNPTLSQFIYPKRLKSEPFDFVKLICIINSLRQLALHNANPVAADITLMSVARNHSEFLAKTDSLTNYGDNNHSVGERLLAQKFPWLTYGQNVARGYKNEWEVIDALMKSSHHRDIILNPSYNHIGAWKVPRGHYWTILFASITPSSNQPPENCLKFNIEKLDQYQ